MACDECGGPLRPLKTERVASGDPIVIGQACPRCRTAYPGSAWDTGE